MIEYKFIEKHFGIPHINLSNSLFYNRKLLDKSCEKLVLMIKSIEDINDLKLKLYDVCFLNERVCCLSKIHFKDKETVFYNYIFDKLNTMNQYDYDSIRKELLKNYPS